MLCVVHAQVGWLSLIRFGNVHIQVSPLARCSPRSPQMLSPAECVVTILVANSVQGTLNALNLIGRLIT